MVRLYSFLHLDAGVVALRVSRDDVGGVDQAGSVAFGFAGILEFGHLLAAAGEVDLLDRLDLDQLDARRNVVDLIPAVANRSANGSTLAVFGEQGDVAVFDRLALV